MQGLGTKIVVTVELVLILEGNVGTTLSKSVFSESVTSALFFPAPPFVAPEFAD